MVFKRCLSVLLAVCGSYVLCAQASATTAAPGFEITGRASPTNLPPGGEGDIKIYVYNLGAAPAAPGAIVTDALPEGLTATSVGVTTAFGTGANLGKCSVVPSSVVKCELPEIRTFGNEEVAILLIHVKVSESAKGTAFNHASVSASDTLGVADASFPVTFSSTPAGVGLANVNVWLTNADGTTDTQAGSHPYELTVAFAVNDTVTGEPFANFFDLRHEMTAGGELRNLNVNLPPGLVGNPLAVPQCTRVQFDEEACPADTEIGINRSTIQGNELIANAVVFNMVPPAGVAAQFAFTQDGTEVFLDSGVRTGGDNGITTHVPNIPERNLTYSSTTIWGVPADARLDKERCVQEQEVCSANATAAPLLTLPTSCQGPQEFSAEELSTWQNEDATANASAPVSNNEGIPVGFTGCERLRPFVPSISLAPDTSYSDTPAGLSVDVKIAQGLNPEGLGAPGLKDTTVTLPEGVVINPGQATGLVACQPSQEALGKEADGEVNEKAASCPSASKVGTDEISTPLLAHKLEGNVYILGQNPPNLQLLVTASGEGVNLKLVGNVHLNEQTGRLTTTFENTPDLPFTDFKLVFSGGAQAALATPLKCGIYGSSAQFVPWAAPLVEEVSLLSRFEINAGVGGSPCQWPMPFGPAMTAGATTDQAGGYTDFTMLLTREDGQQRMGRLQFKTPEGLLGMISQVQLCLEPQASRGECSSAAQIGHTVTTAGPGPYPFEVPQAGGPPAPIYLTGPFEGAPYGLSIVVPVVAGPFNLGTVVVRAKIEVDPHTSQLTITTGQLPLILDGIPTDLRSIDAVIDRPNFMFNPTSCTPMSFSGTAFSNEGSTAPLSSHFQVGSCQALKFQPDFKVSTSGKTSRANGASLTARIVYPVGNLGFNQASSQSNIHSVKVDLPKQLPSRLTTLQKACPAKTFEADPANCPSASVVGHAKAITPLLPVSIEGPAYFVSHAGEEFPSLIAVLQGDNVTVDLVGSTFINNKTNITSSTFKEVPDVPIQSFELNLPQGKYSALAANGNLCKVTGGLKMPTAFTGQNGAVLHQSTPVSVTGCPKAKKAKKTKAKDGHGSSKAKRK